MVLVFNAEKLRNRRTELGLSINQTATRMPGPEAGSPTTVGMLEKGLRRPSARMVAKLAYALQCDITEFFDEVEAPDVVA